MLHLYCFISFTPFITSAPLFTLEVACKAYPLFNLLYVIRILCMSSGIFMHQRFFLHLPFFLHFLIFFPLYIQVHTTSFFPIPTFSTNTMTTTNSYIFLFSFFNLSPIIFLLLLFTHFLSVGFLFLFSLFPYTCLPPFFTFPSFFAYDLFFSLLSSFSPVLESVESRVCTGVSRCAKICIVVPLAITKRK